MTKIIDVHSHFIPPSIAQNTAFFKVNWSDINRHLSVMDECGIEKSVLLYPTSDAHLNMGGWKNVCKIYNEEIAKIVKQHPTRFIGAGILPPTNSVELKEELKRIEDSGLQVISLASSYDGLYLDDELFFPVYEFAAKRGMPVHVHPQIMNPIGEERVRDPLLTPVLEYVFDVSMCIGKMMMSGTLERFSDVKFIFAHFGGVLPIVKERFDNTYQMLRKRNFVKDIGKLPSEYFANLYVDVSGSKSPASLLCALEVVSEKNILFGSDFPANQNILATIETIQKSTLTQEAKGDILKDNWNAVCGAVSRR